MKDIKILVARCYLCLSVNPPIPGSLHLISFVFVGSGKKMSMYCFNSFCSVADMLMVYGSVLQLETFLFFICIFCYYMLFQILLTHFRCLCL